MNNLVHRISLDIHKTVSQVSISVKKGDTARSLYITLRENGKPYHIAGGCYAVLMAEKPDGNKFFNDCTITDNVIVYDFTEQTVPVVGQVHCEVTLYDADGESITSPHFDIIVDDVVFDDVETFSFNEATALINATAEAKGATAKAKVVTAEVEQKLANGDFVGAKGDKGEDANTHLFANAVKGSATGEVVRVDDVSPCEHTLTVKLESKNLIPYPYTEKIKTQNGMTYTIDETDKGIILNGIATENSSFNLLSRTLEKIKIVKGHTYTISCFSNFTKTTGYAFIQNYVNGVAGEVFNVRQGSVTFTPTETGYAGISVVALKGAEFNNEKVFVQLEKGAVTATEYIPYVVPTTATVTRYGVDETDNLQTYTPNADGTVEGITSLSPTMTLLTDTDGAVIHCEYNRDTNKALSSMQTADGTVVSQNADFAEVAEWADGNPDNEDRTGYFVCANVPVNGIVMKKATSIDDVKGVSILAPAFAGNYSKDKVDSNGNLLPKYSYVAIIGFVPVRDNGTCTVGGRCMPDDNGCAIPSSNNMGYQVINRIDENRVLIIIEPNGDMVQRIKTETNQLQEQINEVKGFITNKQGEIIVVNDIVPEEHELTVKLANGNTETDFTEATVSRYGKNLIPNNHKIGAYYNVTIDSNGKYKRTNNGINFEYRTQSNTDNIISLKGTATAGVNEIITELLLPVGVYTLSCVCSSINGKVSVVCVPKDSTATDENSVTLTDGTGNGNLTKSGTLVVTTATIYIIKLVVASDTAITNTAYISRLMLETGARKTEYEEGIDPQTATADTNGCVSGITSVYPNMTLLTDKPNIVIDIAYKRDEFLKYGLPVLELNGDTRCMTKDNKVNLNYIYNGTSGTCEVKWQGSSSLSYPKKNYTVKFYNEFEAVSGWGKRKKYCLKANYMEHSHARNVISAKLWGQVVKSRSPENTMLKNLINGGAIDGFPVVIKLNGEFHGLYTFNTPKDELLFGMSESSTTQAFVCADNSNNGLTRFRYVDDNGNPSTLQMLPDVDFELEFPEVKVNSDRFNAIKESLNNLIQAVDACANGTGDVSAIDPYIDWQSAIDYYCFAVAIGGMDICQKNYILFTNDGVKWYVSAYDMDSTYGINWDGKAFIKHTDYSFNSYANNNNLFKVIKEHKTQELVSRYNDLRNGALSEGNVEYLFNNFCAKIPAIAYDDDVKKWEAIPSTSVNNVHQILNWYRNRVVATDKQIEAMKTSTN